MSAAFRLKQKLKEQKSSTKDHTSVGKINSPLAKYEHGELKCVVCDSVVRSEKAWPVHINSKKHKENIAVAKELKEKVKTTRLQELNINKPQPAKQIKRPATPPPVTPAVKKLKGILKNSNARKNEEEVVSIETHTSLIKKDLVNINRGGPEAETKMDVEEAGANELPDGFFDNPREDAKAHHREFKDPNDEEWERFQKEIKEAQTISTQIINEEQEESTAERQIIEIDEQMRIWSKVLDLEKKKEEVVVKVKAKPEPMDQDDKNASHTSSSEDEDIDVDEYLDWRAKRSHK